MAGWFVGPIVDKIINACSDYLQDQYRWQTGMKEELDRLRENHPKIQAVVSAYTPAQIRDRNSALNIWLWQLRDAIDEADDVLDDFEYMKLEEEQQEQKTKVRSAGTSLFAKTCIKIRKGGERALKIDPNLERLEAVVKKLVKVSAEVSTFLPLIKNAKQEQQLQFCKDRETGCLPKYDLIGRVEEKNFVMQWLRNPTNTDPTLYKNISLLSVVGDGGMGKTTLLQHIYEDLKEEFELKMWVCVSNGFDAKKVIADMLECLKEVRPRLESPLAVVQERLRAVVQSKRFLLVLDDIWEEDMSKWDNVLCPLVYGGLGSKILLTARMDSVALAIAKVIKKKMETLRIKGLEEDMCLELLNTHAFGVENLGAHKKLADIASSIVKKLSGSPLVAKVIGGVLNSNLDENFWKNILNTTDILNVKSELASNNILPILKLSFKFLRQHLQNCFAFCGIFPQDHEFDKDDLVRMWIALGFIQKSPIEGETLEDIGGMYLDALVRKSFFDEFQDDKRIYYKMHDLLHDLAQSISSDECFRFVRDDVSSFNIPNNVRHLFVKTKNSEVLRMVKDVKNLRSLIFIDGSGLGYFTEVFTEIFMASRSIRLLFIDFPLQIKMSEAIENLRHLRYLNFTGGLIQMPRAVSNLYHLQFIIYKMVFLISYSEDFLPGDVNNLSNLRHLVLLNGFSKVPEIGKLRSLQELNEFNVKNEDGYRIGELEHMNELRKLKIHFLRNVKDATEARKAKLFEKRKLTHLFLNWGNTVDEWNPDMKVRSRRYVVNSDLDVNVLENLKPYENLRSLSIFSYMGVSSATWMYDADLISNLEYVCLRRCSKLETLPPFGQFRHLKSLYLCDMPNAKRHGNDEVSVFPSLEVLNMEGLHVLEDWFDGAAAYDSFFPCLTELILNNCPNLQELPHVPPKLKKMKIQKIGWKAALNCKQGSSNCCDNSKSIPLESLEVLSCPEITSLLQADVRLEALRKLSIEDCPNLISLGGVVIDDPSLLPTVSIEAEQWFPHFCSSLRELSFRGLKSLPCLPSFLERLSSLKILRVEKVPQFQQLLHIPASLEELYLEDLESLQCLPSSMSAISSLNHLWLRSIPLLESLPELPPSLNSVSLCKLDKLQCLPSSLSTISSLNLLSLDNIPLLKSLPDFPSSCLIKVKNCHPELRQRRLILLPEYNF